MGIQKYCRKKIKKLKKRVWPLKYDFFPSDRWNSVAVIDLVDACNLKCPECIRGSGTMPNSDAVMSLALFDAICKKLREERVRAIDLFNWTEPFLCKEIASYVKHAHDFGFSTNISSNLSLPFIPALNDVFDAGLNGLWVSVSGFTDEVQGIYHRGSKTDVVKDHLRVLASTPDYAKKTTVKFLTFSYNQQDIKPYSEFANQLGLGFVAEKGYGDPLTARGNKLYTTKEKISAGGESADSLCLKYDSGKVFATAGQICPVAAQLTIDCHGRLYLCCDRPNNEAMLIGNYLEMTAAEILAKKALHPECRNCATHYQMPLYFNDTQKKKMREYLF